MSQTEMARRLREARLAAGFKSASAAARSMGRSVPTYTAHENGGRKYDEEDARIYGLHFGVDAASLLLGDVENHETDSRKNNSENLNNSSLTVVPKAPPALGAPVDFSSLGDQWEMPSLYLKQRLKIREDRARVFEVRGDYMYDPDNPAAPGSLFPGERVIIDIDDVNPNPPGAFAVQEGEGTGMTVKLIEVIPNSSPILVRLTGRNPRYATFERPLSEVAVIGRVKAKVVTI